MKVEKRALCERIWIKEDDRTQVETLVFAKGAILESDLGNNSPTKMTRAPGQRAVFLSHIVYHSSHINAHKLEF